MKHRKLYYLIHPTIGWKALRTKLSDKYALTSAFKKFYGYDIDWANPQTFSEKLQWLKLYDRKSIYTNLVDKYECKKIVAKIIGNKYIIPTLGVWNRFDEIDFTKLPNQFVLKCTHDSGSVVICKDKSTFDIESAKFVLERGLKTDFYQISREWPYKNVQRRIIAEQFIADENTTLKDYKFFCFGGVPEIMYISNDGAKLKTDEITTTDFFDMDFKHLPLRMNDANSPIVPTKPQEFEEMKSIASTLSQGIPFVRIDLYATSKGVFFGEYTFYHNGGYFKIHPYEYDKKLGGLILLPR